MNTKKLVEELLRHTKGAIRMLEGKVKGASVTNALLNLDSMVGMLEKLLPKKDDTSCDVWVMSVDEVYAELHQIVPLTLAFGDYHPDTCLRISQLFTRLDVLARNGELPTAWKQ